MSRHEHYATYWRSGIPAPNPTDPRLVNTSFDHRPPIAAEDTRLSFAEPPIIRMSTDDFKRYQMETCAGCGVGRAAHNPWRGDNRNSRRCPYYTRGQMRESCAQCSFERSLHPPFTMNSGLKHDFCPANQQCPVRQRYPTITNLNNTEDKKYTNNYYVWSPATQTYNDLYSGMGAD